MTNKVILVYEPGHDLLHPHIMQNGIRNQHKEGYVYAVPPYSGISPKVLTNNAGKWPVGAMLALGMLTRLYFADFSLTHTGQIQTRPYTRAP